MDIREIYKSLSDVDRRIYQQIRTDIRKVYLNAHTNILGMHNWAPEDDALLDMLDIKIAVLFDRAGHIESTKPVIDKEEIKEIEDKIDAQEKAIGNRLEIEMSEASKKLASLKENGHNVNGNGNGNGNGQKDSFPDNGKSSW